MKKATVRERDSGEPTSYDQTVMLQGNLSGVFHDNFMSFFRCFEIDKL